MIDRTNRQIIDDIIIRCAEKLEKQMFLLDNILAERETLSYIEDTLYYYVAGNILLLKPDGSDTSNNPVLQNENHKEYYEEERSVMTKYLMTIIQHEVQDLRQDAREECIQMLKTTTRTFSKEYLNVVHLIILFDKDELYSNLCKPLADYCISILYNEYEKEEKRE